MRRFSRKLRHLETALLAGKFPPRAGPAGCERRQILGGPQCGILIGRAALIEKLSQNPLMRTFRVDKLTYAALEATWRTLFGEARLPARNANDRVESGGDSGPV